MSSTGIRRWRATDLAADDTLRVAQVVCRHLGELRVPHFITGSLASSVHGVPRATHDADLIALLDERHVNPLAKRLEGDFHFDEDRLRLAIRTKRSCNVIHLPTMTKVDLYVADSSRRSVEAFARVCWIEIGDFTFPVSSAEESILSKLQWYRDGGEQSDQQWRDIQGILTVSGSRLDLAFLERWTSTLGLSDLWDRALRAGSLGR